MNMVRAVEADRQAPETGFTHVASSSASRTERPGLPPTEGQPGRAAAIAFITDDTTEAALRGGLVESMGNVQIRRGGVRAACRALESESSPRVLVVDVSGVEDPIRELDKLALVC